MTDRPTEPDVPLKNPAVAALLAFLVPGAGHLYQGRYFKGIIYLVCILTLFVWGMQIGEWKLVYRLDPGAKVSPFQEIEGFAGDGEFELFREHFAEEGPSRANTRLHWGFLAQAPIGLFSLPALLQENRYYSQSTDVDADTLNLDQEVEAAFEYLDQDGNIVRAFASGRLALETVPGDYGLETRGTFTGQTDNGEITVELAGSPDVNLPIGASRYRQVFCPIESIDGVETQSGELIAAVERPWKDRFLVPPNDITLERLHRDLGKSLTLAEVFTWIAGMLNVLAIWDAFAGPAYGYRMPVRSKEDEDADDEPEKTAAASSPA